MLFPPEVAEATSVCSVLFFFYIIQYHTVNGKMHAVIRVPAVYSIDTVIMNQ